MIVLTLPKKEDSYADSDWSTVNMNTLLILLMLVLTFVIVSLGVFFLKFSATPNPSTRVSGLILVGAGAIGCIVYVVATL